MSQKIDTEAVKHQTDCQIIVGRQESVGDGAGRGEEINQRTCMHAYKHNQWVQNIVG